MRYIKFFLQEALKIFLIFAFIYIWLKSTTISRGLAFAISFTSALIIDVFLLLLSRKQNLLSTMKAHEQKEAEEMFLSLATDKNALDFFVMLFKSRYKDIQRKNNHIIFFNSNRDSTLFYPYLKIQPLTIDDVINIIKIAGNHKNIIITCNEISCECRDFIQKQDLKITLKDKYQTYQSLYQEYDFFPSLPQIKPELKQNKIKEIAKIIFDRKRTKSYIISAVVLFLSSFYVHSIYYKVIASLLLIFAFISLFSQNLQTKRLL